MVVQLLKVCQSTFYLRWLSWCLFQYSCLYKSYLVAFFFLHHTKPLRNLALRLPFLLSHTFSPHFLFLPQTPVLWSTSSQTCFSIPPLCRTVPYLGHWRNIAAYSSLGSELAFVSLEYLFPIYMQWDVVISLVAQAWFVDDFICSPVSHYREKAERYASGTLMLTNQKPPK